MYRWRRCYRVLNLPFDSFRFVQQYAAVQLVYIMCRKTIDNFPFRDHSPPWNRVPYKNGS